MLYLYYNCTYIFIDTIKHLHHFPLYWLYSQMSFLHKQKLERWPLTVIGQTKTSTTQQKEKPSIVFSSRRLCDDSYSLPWAISPCWNKSVQTERGTTSTVGHRPKLFLFCFCISVWIFNGIFC